MEMEKTEDFVAVAGLVISWQNGRIAQWRAGLMHDLSFKFTARLWLYSGKGAWHFVTLPNDAAAEIRFFNSGRRGFKMVPVTATIGTSTWKTSIFPDSKSGSYVLAVKAAVRKSEGLGDGDEVEVRINTRS